MYGASFEWLGGQQTVWTERPLVENGKGEADGNRMWRREIQRIFSFSASFKWANTRPIRARRPWKKIEEEGKENGDGQGENRKKKKGERKKGKMCWVYEWGDGRITVTHEQIFREFQSIMEKLVGTMGK